MAVPGPLNPASASLAVVVELPTRPQAADDAECGGVLR